MVVSPIVDNMLVLAAAFAVGETVLMLVSSGGGPVVARIHAARHRIVIAAAVGMAVGAGLGMAGVKGMQ